MLSCDLKLFWGNDCTDEKENIKIKTLTENRGSNKELENPWRQQKWLFKTLIKWYMTAYSDPPKRWMFPQTLCTKEDAVKNEKKYGLRW